MNQIILDETEIVTLFTLTEKSIKDIEEFMSNSTYKTLPSFCHEMFEDRLNRTRKIHSRFCSHLSLLIPKES